MTDQLERFTQALAGRYKIEGEIGAGGMATVYLAEDVKHHRKVAVKVLRSEFAAVLGAERFLKEIEVTANLQHPNILQLYDSGVVDGLPFYVMSYVDGESLREKVSRENQLDMNEAIRIIEGVSKALDYAHRHGVIHRDIKPENILLQDMEPVVADFGIALAISEAGGSRLTETGLSVGTPHYMSPEQAAGDEAIDARSDVYALGCMLYEMVTGQPPFTGSNAAKILRQHMVAEAEAVSTFRGDVPAEVVAAINGALAKEPEDRFDTAASFAGALSERKRVTVTPTEQYRGFKAAAVTAFAFMAIIVIVLLRSSLTVGSSSTLDRGRVIVGILENETGEPENDAIGKMAQDWFIQGLVNTVAASAVPPATARQAALFVQAQIAADPQKDPVEALATETGAAIVVTGAIYREGDDLRLQVSVTNAERGEIIGSLEPVRGPVSSVGSVIDSARVRLLGLLSEALDPRLASGFASGRGSPPTLDAYEEFNQGMDAYVRFDVVSAAPHFLRAYELDSTYSTSLVFAAMALANVNRGASDSLLNELNRRRADLSEYERHWIDHLKGYLYGDFQSALLAMREAVQIAPQSKAVYNRAMAARQAYRPQEAVDALRSVDPDRGALRDFVLYWGQLSESLHHLGDYDAALAESRRGRDRHPQSFVILRSEFRALAAIGRTSEIQATLANASGWLAADNRALAFTEIIRELYVHDHTDAAAEMNDSALAWFERRTERAAAWHRLNYSQALAFTGRFRDAIAAISPCQPDGLSCRGLQGWYLARAGDTLSALQIADWLEDSDFPYAWRLQDRWLAVILFTLGMRDRAYEALERAVNGGQSYRDLHKYIPPKWLDEDAAVAQLMAPVG